MSVAKVYARAIDAGRYTKEAPAKRKKAVEKELKALKEKRGENGKNTKNI